MRRPMATRMSVGEYVARFGTLPPPRPRHDLDGVDLIAVADGLRVTARSCSWCDAMNDMTGGPVTCRECRHRADVPRMLCDCQACQRGASTFTPTDIADFGLWAHDQRQRRQGKGTEK